MSNSNAASDPLYYDVSPVYERYTRLFLFVSGLVCLGSIICAIVKAHDKKKFYIIIISLVSSIFFVVCIYLFFKRRILLAEKLWFVNLTICILFLQALIYLIFVLIKPYPIALTTTTATTLTSTDSTTSGNTTNMTNITSTTTTSSAMRQSWEKQLFLTKLYELAEEN
ncbi:unnamed protein product [Rotaria socialis]|uniref:Uncharacterized protein n=1 Tax=Rotaria socialis TaxID=392032 RepID=A0A817TNA3_9BILA|nr:unnamed protein product [Rotaria socialis]CAF4825666.1 unnamed protein product [Rotaria socialis]